MPRKTVRNKITSDELTEQINPDNIDLMDEFLKHKGIKVSEKTITVYGSNLLIFFTWNLLYNKNKHFTEIRKLEFSNFFSFAVNELELGSSRLNNIRSTLSSLSTFLEKFYDDLYPNFRNVILTVIDCAPKEVRREKTILTDEQIEDLLEYLSKKDKQKACWLALAVCSGARFSELLRFKADLIDENRTAFGGVFLETTRKIKTKGRGKSGKQLYKYIFKEKFLPYYHAWIKEREKILKKKNKTHDFLFVKDNGSPITEFIIRGWLREFEEYLEVPFYAHALRHYLATLLSKKDVPHKLIKEIFGWSSLEMVSLYDDSSLKDRAYEELENLKI